jgi:hypothetical protein
MTKDRDCDTAPIVEELEKMPPWDEVYTRLRFTNATIFQSDDGKMLHIFPITGGYLAVETEKLMADLAPFAG